VWKRIRWWIDRARHVALEYDRVADDPAPAPARPRAEPWCRMPRRGEDLLRPAISTILPRYNDRNTVRPCASTIAEIVADEEQREAELLLQVLQQVDDLRLDRDVERPRPPVADDQFRVPRQCPGNANALARPPENS